jgi:Protein of unknown function (DUF2591)
MMKTSELTGAALDWAVAKCEEPLGGYKAWVQADLDQGILHGQRYSTDWLWGGEIIERERLSVYDIGGDEWGAEDGLTPRSTGATPLIAAMRCYVASKLGDEVQLPPELAA